MAAICQQVIEETPTDEGKKDDTVPEESDDKDDEDQSDKIKECDDKEKKITPFETNCEERSWTLDLPKLPSEEGTKGGSGLISVKLGILGKFIKFDQDSQQFSYSDGSQDPPPGLYDVDIFEDN